MSVGWAFAGEPAAVGSEVVTLVEGPTFCLASRNGDIEPETTQGLFVLDTRVVSTWQLLVDEQPLQALTVLASAPYQATFLGQVPARKRALLVRRDRYVGTGMREDITLVNLSAENSQCELALAVHCDFADLFEVKEDRVRGRGAHEVALSPDALTYVYNWRDRSRSCRIATEAQADAKVLPGLLVFRVLVPARGQWTTRITITATADGEQLPMQFPLDRPVQAAVPALAHSDWEQRCTQIEAADVELARTLRRSRADLGSLRLIGAAQRHGEHAARTSPRTSIAAGAPWFMTLFGRDSLLTSYLTLLLDPSLAVGTLQTLAAGQGQRVDPRTEEEPGKILHEVRFGMDAALALGGGATGVFPSQHVYYGTADATPLFVMLLGELHRWGLAKAEVAAFLPHADRALEWIERYGDRDGDGFVEYQRTTDRGLVNQGWKDSWDGVNFADGRLAEPPIALAEVQGYVYAAYRARAQLARDHGDTATAHRATARAAAIRRAFNEQFWLPERGWYAVALDRDKRPVDALASNMGHCLWTGIIEPDRARIVADKLLSPAMFTGWGVRTLAATMAAYNPLSYHNGSVWPHDNALVAAGLMRYGLIEQAQRVVLGMLSAATAFGGRLPELFCGFDRAEYPAPVPYPRSCSPQAWAAATPVHLLRVLLRLDPDLPDNRVWMAPALPPGFGDLALRGLRLGDGEAEIQIGAGEVSMTALPAGIGLMAQPRPPYVEPELSEE